jgi:hypothetical protein
MLVMFHAEFSLTGALEESRALFHTRKRPSDQHHKIWKRLKWDAGADLGLAQLAASSQLRQLTLHEVWPLLSQLGRA